MAHAVLAPTSTDNINSTNSATNGAGSRPLHDTTNSFDFDYAECEEPRIRGQSNTWITFGRDRPFEKGDSKPESWYGYGPKGAVKAGAIDIVAGRMGYENSSDEKYWETVNGKREQIKVPNNFALDASRIYISQRADIDEYFKLSDGATGKESGTAAIGIKSDEIRIIARNTMKLIVEGSGDGTAKLSNGNNKFKKVGVQLIGENSTSGKNSDMQPIPKGINLVKAINELATIVFELSGLLETFAKIQTEFNDAIANHTHIEMFYGLQTSPSVEVIPQAKITSLQTYSKLFSQCRFFCNNIKSYTSLYLSPTSKYYINSRYHKLN